MAKSNVTAVKRVGRYKPGESFRVTAAEKTALIKLRLAREPDEAPKAKAALEAPVAKVTRSYVRRDMVANQPAPAAGSPYFTKGD